MAAGRLFGGAGGQSPSREAFEKRRGGDVQRFERTINTLRQRELLGYLAYRNVLPKMASR